MKPVNTRKWIGAMSVLLGVLWISSSVLPLAISIRNGDFETGEIVMMLTLFPLMAIPGVIATVFGIRLFREMRDSHLKWVLGVFALLFAFFISSRLSAIFPDLLPQGLQESVMLLVASLVSVVAYLFAARVLLRHFTKEDRSARSFLSRGVLMLIAWQIWLVLSQVFQEYSPVKDGYTYVPEEPWGLLGLIVPIVAACGFYKVSAHKLKGAV